MIFQGTNGFEYSLYDFRATDISFDKVDLCGDKIANAELSVYKLEDVTDGQPNEGAEAVATWVTEEGESNQLLAKLLPGKEYVLVETETPDGYVTADPIYFTVNDDRTASTVTMVDKYADHPVTIRKTDVNGDDLSGAKLQLTGTLKGESEDYSYEPVEFVSDAEAPYEAALYPGDYTLTEEEAPDAP